ncbi:MAG: hypothetical protein AAFW76_05170, partial [Pseudomonadota bacterium]
IVSFTAMMTSIWIYIYLIGSFLVIVFDQLFQNLASRSIFAPVGFGCAAIGLSGIPIIVIAHFVNYLGN